MAHPKVKISDNSGNTVGVTNNRLDVGHPAGMSTFTSYDEFTAGTSPTPLSSGPNGLSVAETAAKEVIIQAKDDNSGYLMVGSSDANASDNGIRVNAGDTLILPIADISNIYIDASAADQVVNVSIIK
tara:strand:- start:493 stop:876 length:384 start_codon:yes stop_codon:yes gene_type:complete